MIAHLMLTLCFLSAFGLAATVLIEDLGARRSV
jgi:hypothetical protein